MIHELNLLENGIDSLEEALLKYIEGSEENTGAYKFAILHFSHFVELIFKYYVFKAHPLLIYRNPFSKNLARENTIGLWDAINFMKNDGNSIPENLKKDIEWLKKLRNDIEHYKFKLNSKEVRCAIGRITREIDDFFSKHDVCKIIEELSTEASETYSVLCEDHEHEIMSARAEARESSEDGETYTCQWCGEDDTVVKTDDSYNCKLCGIEDEIVLCCRCEQEFRISDVTVWNDEHPPGIDYICCSCEDYILNKD